MEKNKASEGASTPRTQGKCIKIMREEHGWSQAELAEKVGVSVKTVKRWEGNLVSPRRYPSRKLCNVSGKSKEELMLGKLKPDLDAVPPSLPPSQPSVPPATRVNVAFPIRKLNILTRYGVPLVVLILLLIGGGYFLRSDAKQSVPPNNDSSVGNIPTIAPPTLSATETIKAMEYYNQYTSGLPTQAYTPATSGQWTNGAPDYGRCENENGQSYHAIPNGKYNFVACVAPSPNLTGDFAVQAELTIQQGDGAGVVFGFKPPPSNGADYNGNYYFFNFCQISSPNCPAKNVFLDHILNGQSVLCLGPDPAPDYRSLGACNVTFPAVSAHLGQPNIVTVIVLHGDIYMYVNEIFIWAVHPMAPVDYPTSGQVGITALDEGHLTDVTFQLVYLGRVI